jgi:hypothetical protein
MKTIKNRLFYTILLAGVFMVSSCGDDFLTVIPADVLTTGTFYKTDGQFTAAINGVYAAIQPFYSGAGAPMHIYGEYRSDNTTFVGSSNASVAARKQTDWFLDGLTTGDNFFRDLYVAISRCNIILDLIDASELSDAQKLQRKGEASVLRAYFYFQLVRLWGEVPLVLHQVKSYEEAFEASATRATVAAIYAQIITDATVGATNLPATYGNADKGRVTKYTAKMLMADAYLTQGKYTEALTQLTGTDGVISSNAFSLRPTYASIWGIANEYNSESIWEINYIQSDTYVNQNATFHDTFGPNVENGYTSSGVINNDIVGTGWGIATTGLINTFETKPGGAPDDRRSMITSTWIVGGRPMHYTTKFFSTHTTINRYGNNWPVYRYAEALLIAAECLNRTGQDALALPYLNAVRTRSGLAASALAGAALTNQIIHERRVEFAHENKRWFDILRLDIITPGTASAIMVAHGNDLRADPNNPNRNNPNDITPPGAFAADRILTKLVYPVREIQVLGLTSPPPIQ